MPRGVVLRNLTPSGWSRSHVKLVYSERSFMIENELETLISPSTGMSLSSHELSTKSDLSGGVRSPARPKAAPLGHRDRTHLINQFRIKLPVQQVALRKFRSRTPGVNSHTFLSGLPTMRDLVLNWSDQKFTINGLRGLGSSRAVWARSLNFLSRQTRDLRFT